MVETAGTVGGVGDLEVKLHQAELLLNVSRTVAAYETLDDLLGILVHMMSAELAAERSTIFLNDPQTRELYSRVAEGNLRREIRILNSTGIAGQVFSTGKGEIVNDARRHEAFDASVDQWTGFDTRSILCAPIRTVKGEVIGVAQALNKIQGGFSEHDLQTMEAICTQAALALQSTAMVERIQIARAQEAQFLDVVSDVMSEIDFVALLHKVMSVATRILNADRSTLFLNDERTNELYTVVGEGLGATQLRLPNNVGIAGTVFTTGESVNIPYAYADLRFNPSFDKQTGYFTRSILCVPVVNKAGRIIGVSQVLNKHGGAFTADDEARLRAFTAQVSMALENAKLFDEVQNMKNYNESVLESMSNGVITLDEDGCVVTCNAAGLRIMNTSLSEITGRSVAEVLTESNDWLIEKVRRVEQTQNADFSIDGKLVVGDATRSMNVTTLPLISVDRKHLGTMILMEDISAEKRMKSTISRYLDAALADQLLASGSEMLEGANAVATVLFSDVRGFTPLTEELGPTATIGLLNEYFTLIVECVQREGGILDKFIGDAMMAIFGLPLAHDDDEDRAVRAAIAMHKALAEWNLERQSRGAKPVWNRVGINTDTVVSGNIGSPTRMDYSVIGDGVNLASRLDGVCKYYGANLLISEFTYERLKGTYRIRELDRILVVGKSQPVGIYEVLDYHTEESFPNMREVLGRFRDGLEAYRARRWPEAIEAFEAALALNPEDGPSRTLVERCRRFLESPPEADWSGVWVLEGK